MLVCDLPVIDNLITRFPDTVPLCLVILLRFNRAEKRAIGLTLMDFSVLAQLTRLGPRSFPPPALRAGARVGGLAKLEPDWQETVIGIITRPPVNQILKVSVDSPSLTETLTTPALSGLRPTGACVALVERPPIPLAA